MYITGSCKIRIPIIPNSIFPQGHVKIVAQPVILAGTTDVIFERISDIHELQLVTCAAFLRRGKFLMKYTFLFSLGC